VVGLLETTGVTADDHQFRVWGRDAEFTPLDNSGTINVRVILRDPAITFKSGHGGDAGVVGEQRYSKIRVAEIAGIVRGDIIVMQDNSERLKVRKAEKNKTGRIWLVDFSLMSA